LFYVEFIPAEKHPDSNTVTVQGPVDRVVFSSTFRILTNIRAFPSIPTFWACAILN